MKIISLLGSPRGLKGNTGRLLRIVLNGAESQGAETEIIPLKGDSVLPCRGCDVCHQKGVCVQKDDFEAIKNKIFKADGLVLASPNYIFGVSAQLKAFMDRCCGIIHCMRFEGKYGASVITSGGGDEAPIAEFMNHFLTITGIVPVGAVWATMGSISEDDFPQEIRTRAFDLGKKIVTDWKNQEKPESTALEMDAFYRRMKRLMIFRKDQWPYEYDYWVRHRNLSN
ncbi:MAG: flavodoxin family protein [Desulfobacterales bacterium]|jgi:multimeric flavodoxin WrbA|nr:flavodoxin family protein [Desulfobacterales bacterium]MDD3081221.1 flavodoxin family protein [Desulfobacterales bacterium]MDD3950231.1 flavodoxin family protein [Desulfobacterales bacterium]MDD4464852.1 flavodoxin family protein [Desulfobacterales bacterium]MDY0378530.1 flavodoxin family protein [Desulfobacterales bacterium]